MPEPKNDLERKIDAAYDYRGHVTLSLQDGSSVEGFVFNREFDNPKLERDNFIEINLKDSEERRKIFITDIKDAAMTGEDAAAGNSYEDYLRKKADAEKKPKP